VKIRLVMLGKTRRREIRGLLEDYLERIRHFAEMEAVELRDSSAPEMKKLKPGPAAKVVLVDAAGKQFSSEQLARWLGEERDRGTRELVFLCGAAEGFPEALRRQTAMKLSLTALTLSHELARVVLAEQIYRAFAILTGHPYPK
jgi:23S rRNA (pseudouridine1915-N3)-methyltransferase